MPWHDAGMTATHDPRWGELNARYCDAVNMGRTHEARRLAEQIAELESECTVETSAPYEPVAQVHSVLAIVSAAAEVAVASGDSSALYCGFDAFRCLAVGNGVGAVRWALRSMEHAAGVFDPAYRCVLEAAVALFPLERLDTYGVLGGVR